MKELSNWTEVSIESLKAMGIKILSVIPNILAAIILILIGWLLAKLAANIILRIFNTKKFKKLESNLNSSDALNGHNIRIEPGKIISKFVYWVVILLFIITATDTLGWDAVSAEVGALIRYLPKLFSALLIFIIGIYLASIIRKLIHTTFASIGISGAKAISTLVFYVIVIILTVTALNQAGINTRIITNNITLILGTVLLSFALAFGLGARDILKNMLSSMYSKRSFNIGDKIKIGDEIGIVHSIDSLNITLITNRGKLIIPAIDFMQQKVEVLNSDPED